MSPLVGLQLNQFTLLLGIGLFLLVMFNRVRRSFAQNGRSPRSRSSHSRSTHNTTTNASSEIIGSARLRSATAPKEQEAWEVEMHELARQLKADIDTRMRALERLIQLADEAQARLDATLEAAESLGLVDEERFVHSAAARNEADEQLLVLAAGAPTKTTAARSRRRDESSVWPSNAASFAEDPRFERVYALADAGFSATKIASQIGSQVGEVELILSLRGT